MQCRRSRSGKRVGRWGRTAPRPRAHAAAGLHRVAVEHEARPGTGSGAWNVSAKALRRPARTTRSGPAPPRRPATVEWQAAWSCGASSAPCREREDIYAGDGADDQNQDDATDTEGYGAAAHGAAGSGAGAPILQVLAPTAVFPFHSRPLGRESGDPLLHQCYLWARGLRVRVAAQG